MALFAGESGNAYGFFEILGFEFDHKHGHGWGSFIDVHEAENAGTHFGCHGEAGKISGTKRVFGKPFVGHDNTTGCFIQLFEAHTGEKCAGQIEKKKKPGFDRVFHEPDE